MLYLEGQLDLEHPRVLVRLRDLERLRNLEHQLAQEILRVLDDPGNQTVLVGLLILDALGILQVLDYQLRLDVLERLERPGRPVAL